MADALTQCTLDMMLKLTFSKATSMSIIEDKILSGSSGFASLRHSLSNGTGPNNARYRYRHQHTFVVGNTDLDLLGGITDDYNVPISFSLLKWILFRVVTPTTGIKLILGNYGANGFQGPIGTTLDVKDVELLIDPIDGWTVDGTHRYLRVNNPGAGTVITDVVLIGE